MSVEVVSDSCLFFGVAGSSGHRLWVPGGPYPGSHPVFGSGWGLDGTLAPRLSREGKIFTSYGLSRDERAMRERGSAECPQGRYLVHVNFVPGWTAASWWDRCQGDERDGCSSTVLLRGSCEAGEIFRDLRVFFPAVPANLERAGIRLVPAL